MVLPFEKPRRADIDEMIRLAIPVVVVQVGMMLFGVVDTMVVGRLSSQALAAVALGHVAVITISSFGVGVLLGIDPLLNQALGARDRNAFRRSVQRGFILAAALMIPSTLFLLPIGAILALLGQPAETVPLAAAYSHISIPGLLPFYGWVVLRLALQAMGRLRHIVATVIAVNIFNLVADWALVFGAGPIPQLGPIGSAWASTIARTLLFVILLTVDRKDLWPLLRFDRESLRLAAAAPNRPVGHPHRFQPPARDRRVLGDRAAHGRTGHDHHGGPPGGHQPRLADLHGSARGVSRRPRFGSATPSVRATAAAPDGPRRRV